MIVDVPADMPLTMPLDDPTVAAEVVPLVHVPPASVFANVVVVPTHTDIVPVSGAGTGFTVSVCVTKHPPGSI